MSWLLIAGGWGAAAADECTERPAASTSTTYDSSSGRVAVPVAGIEFGMSIMADDLQWITVVALTIQPCVHAIVIKPSVIDATLINIRGSLILP